ncbi:hypothetical protein BDN70DRAFT_887894 [Pholiota conissans]|uniref:Uncharacterized protein n=1 Tax=Pholiota conissans TaxID=109636 RepID=A0A9P5YN28_9AGAR|nr:hypothetical protein BDN70DRAFT_887894 [Pholiota conissans]
MLFADESHPWPQRSAILSDWELLDQDVPDPHRDRWVSVRWFFFSHFPFKPTKL